MALWRWRHPEDVTHHLPRRAVYSLAFRLCCNKDGVRPSAGSLGDCFDNAMWENFSTTVEFELLDRHGFPTLRDAQSVLFKFIDGWYKPRRRHSAL